ncbi:MAG: class I SAM-dependent methyltransferase [Planctomycetes bacterium]|nr:class I SAM-dependent methyltransferase [Planctomycetota bacterium]
MPKTVEATSLACDCCGARAPAPFGEEHGYRLVRCSACGLIYVDPQPGAADLARIYREQWERGGASSYYSRYTAARRGHEHHARRLLAWLERFRPPGRLLEIGCGAGFFLSCARKRGWDVLGVEPAGPFVAYARETLGIDVLAADLDSAHLPSGQFQAAAMIDLLSHLPSPAHAIARVRELLAPGGFLLIQAGNRGEFKRIPRGADWDTPLHLFHFTRLNLHGLLARSGFEVLWTRSEPKPRLLRAARAVARPWMRRVLAPPYRCARAALGALRALDPRGEARILDRTVYMIARAGPPDPLQTPGGGR